MSRKDKYIKTFTAPIVTALILLIVYAIKGVYPFGSGSIMGGDLYQLYLPNYLHTYDVWHGGSFFYDLTAACGSAKNELVSVFKPTTWFILLFPREKLADSMSLLVMLKLVVIALAGAFSFSKLFSKLSAQWVTALALMYTLSGYDLQYFTNLNWLDAVALYPLLILGLKNMFDKKSKLPYILVLTYLLCVQSYIAYLMLVSLVVFGGCYIFIAAEKENRKAHIYSLGVGTLISLAASAYPFYAFFSSNVESQRFVEYGGSKQAEGVIGNVLRIASLGIYKNINAVLMLLGFELALACLLMLFIKSFKELKKKRTIIFFGISFVLIVLQIALYGSELLWHGGSRVMFPFRNGFMVAFLGCLIVGYYFSQGSFKEKAYRNKKSVIAAALLCAVFTVLSVILAGSFYGLTDIFYVANIGKEQNAYFKPFILFFLALSAVYFCLLVLFNRNKKTNLAALTLALAMIAVNTFCFVGNPEGGTQAEKYKNYFDDCYSISKAFEDNDDLDRVENPDLSLITNYSYFSGASSVTGWVNNIPANQIDALRALSFGTVYTRTLGCGATGFANALFNVQNSVSKTELNEKLYKKIGQNERGINMFKNRYTIPVGTVFDSRLSIANYSDYANTFEYQNEIFSSLKQNGKLFERITPESSSSIEISRIDYLAENPNMEKSLITDGTVNLGTAKLKTNKNSTLYLSVAKGTMFYRLKINGKTVIAYKHAESDEHLTNTKFPSGYNNNVLELGCYDGEEIELEFELLNGDISSELFYSMDNSALESLCASLPETNYSVNKDTITVSAYSDKEGFMFIPVSFSPYWSCTLNGVETDTEEVLGGFLAVPVEAGKNSVVLKYSGKSAWLLLLSNIAAYGIALGLAFLEKRIKADRALTSLFSIAFTIIFAGALLLLYGLPIFMPLIL